MREIVRDIQNIREFIGRKKIEIAFIASMVIGTGAGITAVAALNKASELEKQIAAQRKINIFLIADNAQLLMEICQNDPQMIKEFPNEASRAMTCDEKAADKIENWDALLNSSWIQGDHR